ncbi:MAG: hypothetical protein HYU24_15560 [Candidatus Rokubacteria bacterium]|nr:hypothetical protein [Candidatus Rokubacteria bacterium]
MNRPVAIAAIVGLLVGVLVGFLWWGMPTQQMQTELAETRKRADAFERQVAEAQAQSRGVQGELKALETRVKTAEEDLRLERDRRSKLEMILSKGRK